MEWNYRRARNGNVALTAQIDLKKCGGEFVLALGFDFTPIGAAHHARASLLDGFDAACDEYVGQWKKWQKPLRAPACEKNSRDLFPNQHRGPAHASSQEISRWNSGESFHSVGFHQG